MSDYISRKDLIDALNDNIRKSDMPFEWCQGMANAGYIIMHQPSAQPEPLTDKEQRIFLAAMGREEMVCKQVDEKYRDCRESYEDSLVKVCHEITRKVKTALWET